MLVLGMFTRQSEIATELWLLRGLAEKAVVVDCSSSIRV
jgi:hypothetical protein